MSENNYDLTVEEYYEQFSNTDGRLSHYRQCGDCAQCLMDTDMAHNYTTYTNL